MRTPHRGSSSENASMCYERVSGAGATLRSWHGMGSAELGRGGVHLWHALGGHSYARRDAAGLEVDDLIVMLCAQSSRVKKHITVVASGLGCWTNRLEQVGRGTAVRCVTASTSPKQQEIPQDMSGNPFLWSCTHGIQQSPTTPLHVID